MWHSDDWPFTRDLSHRPDPTPMWMDARHVGFIYEMLMNSNITSLLEIGCYMGFSTSALIQAKKDRGPAGKLDITCVDIRVTQELTQVVGDQGTIIESDSLPVLLSIRPQMVIVDGDHEIRQVSRELGSLLYQETETIIAHDVNFAGPGFSGSRFLGDVLRVHPAYQTAIDDKKRPGEFTERGFLFATRNSQIWAAAQQAWQRMGEA